MLCASCGQENSAGDTFCTSCGSPLGEGPSGEEKIRGWKGLPFYTRVTIAGLVGIALVYTALGVLALIGGGVSEAEDAVQGIVFYLLFMIPTVVVIILAWRSNLTIVAAIWAALVLFITGPTIPNALGAFNSFFDAGLLIPGTVSLIVACVAGIAGLIQQRRGAASEGSTAGARLALSAIVAAVAGLMVVSGILHLIGLESVSADEKAGTISVDIENSVFKPAQLTVPSGKAARFFIRNRDLTVHTFTIDELGIDVKVLPGSEALVELPAPAAGVYVYECTAGVGFSLPLHKPEVESEPSIPSDSGMLVVRDS